MASFQTDDNPTLNWTEEEKTNVPAIIKLNRQTKEKILKKIQGYRKENQDKNAF
jgi:hypothetical protein